MCMDVWGVGVGGMDNMEVATVLAAGTVQGDGAVARRRSLNTKGAAELKYQGGGGCHEEECRW